MEETKSWSMVRHYDALKDYIGKGFVFKKCTDVTEFYNCIVILKKPSENFQSNEDRIGIINKNFAKFRCNGLITVAIYDLYLQQFRNSLDHSLCINYNFHKILYQVGKLSIPHEYNKDVSIICTSGLHYFLSLEAALNYFDARVTQEFYNQYIQFDNNGKQQKIIQLY